MKRRSFISIVKATACAGLTLWAAPLPAQETLAPQTIEDATETEAAAARLRQEREEAARKLDQLSRSAAISAERQKILTDSIAALAKDSETLSAALIEAATLERQLAESIAINRQKITQLTNEAAMLKTSLFARRGILAEVLAALQRMGINPPPAILIRPDDALSSVRSAILLSAVVPDMKNQTDRLLADLNRLAAVQQASLQQQDQLQTNLQGQAEEQERLKLLLEEKAKQQSRSLATLEQEKQSTEQLTAEAEELRALLSGLDTELNDIEAQINARRAAVEAARQAEDQRLALGRERAQRLAPSTQKLDVRRQFSQLKALMPPPVAGSLVRQFGEETIGGKSARGDTIATNSGAIVTIPADGVVRFAGPFRTFGNLLIIDMSEGYRLVLAGMALLAVEKGQTVLAGEPVALMGEERIASAVSGAGLGGESVTPINNTSSGVETSRPELYVEVRKDGQAINPSAWWRSEKTGRLGNDS